MRVLSVSIVALFCITSSALTLVNENHCSLSADQPVKIAENLIIGLFDDETEEVLECLLDPNIPESSKHAVLNVISPAWNLDEINFDLYGLEVLKDENSSSDIKQSVLKAYALSIDSEKNKISNDAIAFLQDPENKLRVVKELEDVFAWIDYRLNAKKEMLFGSSSSSDFFRIDRSENLQEAELPELEKNLTSSGLIHLVIDSEVNEAETSQLINAFNLSIKRAKFSSQQALKHGDPASLAGHLLNMVVLVESVEEWNSTGRVVTGEMWTDLFKVYKEFWQIREKIDPESKLSDSLALVAVDLLGFEDTEITYLEFLDHLVIGSRYMAAFNEFQKELRISIYSRDDLATNEYILLWKNLLKNSYKINTKSTFPLLVAASFQQNMFEILKSRGVEKLDGIYADHIFTFQNEVFDTLVEHNPFWCMPEKSTNTYKYPNPEWDARKLPCIGWGYVAEAIYDPLFKFAIQDNYNIHDIQDYGISLFISDYETVRILLKNENYASLYKNKESMLPKRDEFYYGKPNTPLTEIICEMVVNDDVALKDALNFFSFRTPTKLVNRPTRYYTSRAGAIIFMNSLAYEYALIDQSISEGGSTDSLDTPSRYGKFWIPFVSNSFSDELTEVCSERQIEVAHDNLESIISSDDFEMSDRLRKAFEIDFNRMSSIVIRRLTGQVHRHLTFGDGQSTFMLTHYFKWEFTMKKEDLINDFRRVNP